MKPLAVLAAVVGLLLTATVALASHTVVGVTPVDLARGTSASAYTITHTANRDIMTQTLTFAQGGTSTTGWHTHPGPVVVIVKSGTLSLWDSVDCTKETYTAGQAVVVPGGNVADLARNEDLTVPLVLVVTYYNVPVGGAQAAPAAAQCTGTAGVPQEVAGSGVTPQTHTSTRLASALNVTGAANTDLLIQQLTWAPGSTTGWHSHPGPVTVSVESGTLNFQASDCTRTAYPQGTTLLDSGTTHEASSATTTLAFATYLNIPAGGAARSDQAAPACTATPAPAPTASALPNTSSDRLDGGGSASAALLVGLMATLGAVSLGVARRRRAR